MTSPYRIIDITRELFSTPPYEGDTAPSLFHVVERENMGGFLTQYLTASLHGATHLDAPLHLLEDGSDVLQIDLAACMGECLVDSDCTRSAKRLLLRGGRLNAQQAKKLDCILVGTDQDSIAPVGAEAAVHEILFQKGVVVLENLDLSAAPDGEYLLIALPLKLKGAEASLVRAILLCKQT